MMRNQIMVKKKWKKEDQTFFLMFSLGIFCKRYIEQSLCNPQIFAILTKNDSESEKDMTPPCCIR